MADRHITRESPTSLQSAGDHAVVIGGSMAGLLAARVLSDHFERVTLIERDQLPSDPRDRKGVPQGRHLHVLLLRGQQIMSSLFPGLVTGLIDEGAVKFDLGGDMRWYQFGGYKTRFDSGMSIISMTRPLLECYVRRSVLGLSNVTGIDQCDVENLVSSGDRNAVTGVMIRRHGKGEESVEADLVVDASGRGSRSPKWLEQLGYAPPEETVVKIGIGYTTRMYRQTPDCSPGATALFIPAVPPDRLRGGGMFSVEGGRWLLTVAGYLGDHAPTEDAGFLEYVRSLATRDIYDVVSRAEPVSDFVTHKFPANLRRHYDRQRRFPEGYLVVGDAMCSFNPIYGQGMSVASMEAEVLDRCLNDARRTGTLKGLARSFFPQAAKIVDHVWSLAVGEDFRFSGVEGPKAPGTDLVNWYVARLHKASQRDPEAARAFYRVMSLTHSPSTIFKPEVLLRVVRNGFVS